MRGLRPTAKGTDRQPYVDNPRTRSIRKYGLARRAGNGVCCEYALKLVF
jgi:hypothetical protein